jgi:hypothetical protein
MLSGIYTKTGYKKRGMTRNAANRLPVRNAKGRDCEAFRLRYELR